LKNAYRRSARPPHDGQSIWATVTGALALVRYPTKIMAQYSVSMIEDRCVEKIDVVRYTSQHFWIVNRKYCYFRRPMIDANAAHPQGVSSKAIGWSGTSGGGHYHPEMS
jgi:hypothetical protein